LSHLASCLIVSGIDRNIWISKQKRRRGKRMSSIFSGKEIKTPNEIKEILESDEKVLYGVQQAGLGGKITGLESVFVTNKRVIKMKPKTLGLRADIEDYLYKDMANVKLDKGILRSSISIVMRFRSDSLNIKNIPKDDAYKIFKAIDDGIAGRLGIAGA
jgi:hypothetical protein